MLSVDGLHAGYAGFEVLHGLSLEVEVGEVVALVGANGAGKTTFVRALSGLVRATSGAIRLDGGDVTNAASHTIVKRGLATVPEGRELFAGLTVRENLLMGTYGRPKSESLEQGLAAVHDLFPVLAERADQDAATLSGGQQQMVAIGRALMASPRLLVLDEPSLGLAPLLVQAVFDTVRIISDRGMTVLMIEQNAAAALRLADRAYVIESGRVAVSGTGQQLLADSRVRTAYLGLAPTPETG